MNTDKGKTVNGGFTLVPRKRSGRPLKETVETVEVAVSECHTFLKEGVNERAKRFLNFEFRFLIDLCSRRGAAGMRLQLGFAEAPVSLCSMIIFFMRAV